MASQKATPSGTEVELPSGDALVHPASRVDAELSPVASVNKGCCDL